MKTQRDGLSEFVSRKGRTKLLKLLLERGWTKSQIAKSLAVTRQAIHHWLKREETHPCNHNLGRLLDLAIQTDSDGTVEILHNDLETFQNLLTKKCKVGS